jgi:hypothetical protein
MEHLVARLRWLGLRALPGALLLAGPPAAGTTITFAKVADSATAVPGGSGSFPAVSFGIPSVDGGAIVFSAGFSANHGIYSDAGGSLHAVVTSGEAIPGGTGGFVTLDPQHFEGGVVPFRGSGSAGQFGIYSAPALSGGTTRVADLNTAIPDGTGNFPDLGGAPDFSAGEYVFRSTVGVYRGTPGSLSTVADTSTPIPGGSGSFTSFGVATLSAGQIVFLGDGGIYSSSDAGLVPVATTSTAIPGGVGNFTGLGSPVVSDGSILLRGTGSLNQRGLYLSADDALSVIADVFTAAPDGVGNFIEFGLAYAIDGNAVAFLGTDGAQILALYTTLGGTLMRVIGAGDELDGKTLTNLQIGLDAISGNTIGFLASFDDGSAGIFSAMIPEPSPLALLAASLLALAWWRRPSIAAS